MREPGRRGVRPTGMKMLLPVLAAVLLLAAGRSNDAIAREIYVSGKTVRNIVSSIYTKLHAPDRAAAIIKAREAGLGRS